MDAEVGKYMTELDKKLRKGWTAHLASEGRIYYLNHETKISSWLPPVESWDSGGMGLPYGWEAAIDKDGRTYYVNHANKTTTYDNPRKEGEEEPPLPRDVDLIRDPQMGFGFVAGSEKPVIVRFVTEGGPNEHKLMPGDQILKINGEDVMRSPRERVIEMIRSCKQNVTLTVCQPQTNNTTRKSALLTAAKKAKLKNNPSRVRFSEGVVINGSPLYSPSSSDSYVPFLPNVLKVFLENGQTKSFKYDSTTTIQDVLKSLQEKLSLKCAHHFSLATEHVKITRRNRLAALDPQDTLAKIAARPGAHHLRCVFRVTFVPKDAYDLLQKDPIAFEYLYLQCCNDVVQERFAPELKYDIALRLAALHIQQHCLSSGMQGKITIKAVERETGLDKFVPISLLETMKRKELRKLLSHFLKQNQSLCAPGQKHLTALQAKLHYLKIISELPSYGAKCFSTNMRDSSPEMALLVSPRFGVGQIACMRNTNPITLTRIEDLAEVRVSKEDEISSIVELFLKDPDRQSLNFSMEDRDAEEFILLLRGYHRLLAEKELLVQWESHEAWQAETVPGFHSRHTVKEAPWSYPPHPNGPGYRTLDLALPPPQYEQMGHQIPRNSSKEKFPPSVSSPPAVDHNMNETLEDSIRYSDDPVLRSHHRMRVDERHPGIDYQSVISMELLEDSSGDIDVDVYEARNDEVIKRISEMNQILIDAETYLSDRGPPDKDPDLECPALKAADSLLLLTQAEKQHEEERAQLALEEELSPSESDTDSTPNDSPLHRSTPVRNSINSAHPMIRRDSSFGLHSPDLLPSISSGNNILDILKHLQSEEIQLPFDEGTLYLDPDLIDLTMIPPPETPDLESLDMTNCSLDAPPTPFLDTCALHKELEKWIKVPKEDQGESSNAIHVTITERGPESLQGASVDIDQFCKALSTMHSDSKPKSETSIESFIASLTVPPPPTQSVSSEDLSAFIIPPPPSSSPSTEAQNEVIARFMAAAEDMKRLFRSDAESCQSGFQELQQFWSEIEDDKALYDVHGGDSSGYDTLTSSLTSYSDTVDVEGAFSFPSSDETTPVLEHAPAPPVLPRLRTSCVDDVTSPLSITSPSSTTSSDSSVILLDGCGFENGDAGPAKKVNRVGELLASTNRVTQGGSCDNLVSNDGPDLISGHQRVGIVRSVSWSNIADVGCSRSRTGDEFNSQKPPIPPNPFQQNRLRRSFNRGSTRNAVLSRAADPPSPRTDTVPFTINDPRHHPNNNTKKLDALVHLNGVTLKCVHSENADKCGLCSRVQNGCVLSNGRHPTANDAKGPFQQAQKDVAAMIGHLRKIAQVPKGAPLIGGYNGDKFSAAKDALVNESRQFVTSSKLFVKSAMESSERMIENMAVCVALLNRMTAIGELVVIRGSPGEPVVYLVDRLRDVAVAFYYTVEAAQQAVGTRIDHPHMAGLMQRATTLATSLTSLMRTLRAMSMV